MSITLPLPWTLLTRHVGNNPDVDKRARTTLAANLKRVIERSEMTRTAWATSKKLDVKAVERAAKGLHAPRLDFVEELAAACGMEAWQLLREDAGEGAALRREVLEIAQALNKLQGDTYQIAVAKCHVIAYTDPRRVQIHVTPLEDLSEPAAAPTPAPARAR